MPWPVRTHYPASIVTDLDSPCIAQARTLWDYCASFRSRGPADLLVLCCSYDLRVADYAAQLLAQGLAPRLMLCGHTGNWTRSLWTRPEAEVFAERAIAAGADPARLIREPRSTNFGENIRYARELVPDARRVIFLTKPAAVLRVSLTAAAQWPGIQQHTDAPPYRFPDEVSPIIGLLGVIHEIVGDFHRILVYPELGFQTPHQAPPAVMAAWRALVDAGFTHHLLADHAVA